MRPAAKLRSLVTFERSVWVALFLAVAGGGWWWWVDRQRYVTTDNAFVDADITLLSSQVSGFVTRVTVTTNEEIRPEQPLAMIEPADFRLRLAAALARRAGGRAALSQLRDSADERQAAFREKIAALRGAQAVGEATQAERRRVARLAESGWVTKRLLQTTTADAAKAKAAIEEASAAIEIEAARRRSISSQARNLAANVADADAEVSRARLELDRTLLRAPVGGIVGPVLVRVGQYVKPGDVVMHVVPAQAHYIIANFKETQFGRLRVGQTAHIELDAYPGRTLVGHVQSLSPATGSKFAAMPIDNANGNFVKIVQRLPVRIAMSPSSHAVKQMLRPGLSANVSIDVDQGN